ncbi:hypothetical protein OH802_20545 [Nocardioides sp. NBC_00850]|uniref:hypothetical protein n=1 Tax=Nocardioides sp. NBC_00850 TaxID=2976001 RepID=UPI00386B386C|nr:hypothetical protein OH802_20545 [Nocardioides sp. NBC_00850]
MAERPHDTGLTVGDTAALIGVTVRTLPTGTRSASRDHRLVRRRDTASTPTPTCNG